MDQEQDPDQEQEIPPFLQDPDNDDPTNPSDNDNNPVEGQTGEGDDGGVGDDDGSLGDDDGGYEGGGDDGEIIPIDEDGNPVVGGGNDTSPFEVDNPLDTGIAEGPSEGNPAVNLILGLLIVLGASALNAFGLNLTKLDHMRNAKLPHSQRRPDYLRPLWVVGMLAYIISQLFGSTLSLRYLRSDWVAPLGSTSLIFNFLFAKWLVGTPVTKEDYRGTALIVLGVILILIFSSINHGLDGSITLDRLSGFWSRGSWLSYFFLITLLTTLTYLITRILTLILSSRQSLSPSLPAFDPDVAPTSSGGRRKADNSNAFVKGVKKVFGGLKAGEVKAVQLGERWLERTEDARILFFTGVGWAVVGGSLAGGCLVFTKAVVKLLAQPNRPFTHPVAIVTVFFVAVTAVLQIICLNKALKAADSTLVVPLFYAGYTVLGFINSLIFLDQKQAYETWVLVAVFLSIAVLIGGVVLLSLKNTDPEANPPGNMGTVSATNPSMRLNPIHGTRISTDPTSTRPDMSRARTNSGRQGAIDENGEEKAWEIGDVSDDDSDAGDGKDRRKSAAGKRSMGERGELLFGDEEDEEDDAGKSPIRANGNGVQPPGYGKVVAGEESDHDHENDDPFGDFEEAKKGKR